jgi:hypothetical protein
VPALTHVLGRARRTPLSKASLKNKDLSTLDYTHGTTSGLKALCSAVASDGIEICRKCCGGHGYSKFSGFVDMYQDYVPACTYEVGGGSGVGIRPTREADNANVPLCFGAHRVKTLSCRCNVLVIYSNA